MQPDWQQLIAKQKHYSADCSKYDSATSAVEALLEDHGTLYSNLAELGCISVRGDDATDFLQGQFSNDVKQVSEEYAQYSAYCTPKGRVLAILLVVRWKDQYWLILPNNLLEGIKNRLQMFVLRSKVELTVESDNYLLIGAMQSNTEKTAAVFTAVADHPYQCAASAHAISVTLPGPVKRALILSELPTALATLDTEVHFAHAALWHWSEITAGLPTIETATQELFTPQMINLDLINAVNFKKGCYPGQEVVARTHYLGKVKRRMHCFDYNGTEPLQPAMEIVNAEGGNVGTLVSCVNVENRCSSLLAVIPLDKADQPLFLAADRNSQLVPMKLPYTFEINNSES